jgi:hypothetical protein
MTTHVQYLDMIRNSAASRLNDSVARKRVLVAKLVYGSGQPGVRGSCFYESWESKATLEFIEVCASGEEFTIQPAGTTLHELAHCLSGPAAGHGQAWKAAAKTLGLWRAQAAGQAYSAADFDQALWDLIRSLPEPADGRPKFNREDVPWRACPLGRGTGGGKSRGPGSGSRLRLFTCACAPPIRVRVERDPDRFRALCLGCNTVFRVAVVGTTPLRVRRVSGS